MLLKDASQVQSMSIESLLFKDLLQDTAAMLDCVESSSHELTRIRLLPHNYPRLAYSFPIQNNSIFEHLAKSFPLDLRAQTSANFIWIDEDGGIDRRKDGIDVLLLLLQSFFPGLTTKLIFIALLPHLPLSLEMTHYLRKSLLIAIHLRPLSLRQGSELRDE